MSDTSNGVPYTIICNKLCSIPLSSFEGYHASPGKHAQFDKTDAEWPGLSHHVTRRRRTITKTVDADADIRVDTTAAANDGQGSLHGPKMTLAGIDLSLAFRETIKRSALYVHCEKFQEIADLNGGNRASGSSGYVASMEYVLTKLADAGYQVYTTDVVADYFHEVLPPKLEGPIDFLDTTIMAYYTFPGSASGTVEAPVYAVDVVFDDVEFDESNSTNSVTLKILQMFRQEALL